VTFADDVSAYDISSGPVDDSLHPNERWFNGTDQRRVWPSNGWPAVMYPTPGVVSGAPVSSSSLLRGGGLQISLSASDDERLCCVMTSVDQKAPGSPRSTATSR
jgi:hypothetical protein